MEQKAAMKLEELQQSLLLIIFGFPVLTGTSWRLNGNKAEQWNLVNPDPEIEFITGPRKSNLIMVDLNTQNLTKAIIHVMY